MQFRLWARKRLFAPVMAACLVATVVMAFGPSRVSAHCPGTDPPGGRDYATGERVLSNAADAIQAHIPYTAKSICTNPSGTGSSVEQLQIQNGLPFVGVGWQRKQDGTLKMFCEFGVDYPTYVFSMTAATHSYFQIYDAGAGVWGCYLDGQWKMNHIAGLISGKDLFSAGEVSSYHSQIGTMAPTHLTYTQLQYRQANNQVWNTWSPNVLTWDSPYGASQAAGQFSDWTNAH